MGEVVLEIKNISKSFRMRQGGNAGIKESLWQLISSNKTDVKDFYALKDISFTVRKGEALGIIGKNGAGKSTLLRILSGITQPDSGEINFYGKAVSILDIGTGFHPELTGMENIYLSASIYGFNKQEIDLRLSEIIDFSGIGDFIEQPVKNYSAGMYLRLAFSIIANLDAEIYLIDEVIGVGDAAFQLKSKAKIESLLKQGKTMIVVSHNLNDIAAMCKRVLLMENGQITEEGDDEIIRKYMERAMPEYYTFDTGAYYHVQKHIPADESFTAVNILNSGLAGEKSIADGISTLQALKIFIELEMVEAIDLDMTIRFYTGTDVMLFVASTYKQQLPPMNRPGKYRVEFEIPARLLNENIYSADLLLVNSVKPEHVNNPEVDHRQIYYRKIDKFLTIKMADEKAQLGQQEKYPGAIRPEIPVSVFNLQAG